MESIFALLDKEFLQSYGMSGIFIVFILMLSLYISSKDRVIAKVVRTMQEQNEIAQANIQLNKQILTELKFLKYAITNALLLKAGAEPHTPNDEEPHA